MVAGLGIHVVKTKALIRIAVTAKLICVFVFAYAKIGFSHVAAHNVLDDSDQQSKKYFKTPVQTGPVVNW